MDLSIIFGTYNRRKYLMDCVESIRASVGSLSYEIIVVDAGSDDGSREYLAVQPDVVLLGERTLEGAIIAFNKGFSLARGWAVVNFNDDAICIGKVLEKSYAYLRQHQSTVGQIAFYYDTNCNGQFRPGDVVNGLQTANLGICQAWLGHAVGWWGLDDHTYGGDNRLSLEIWKLGYKVITDERFRAHHVQAQNGARRPNLDASSFWKRWEGRQVNIPARPVERSTLENAPIIRPW